jgi:hypothetical protein
MLLLGIEVEADLEEARRHEDRARGRTVREIEAIVSYEGRCENLVCNLTCKLYRRLLEHLVTGKSRTIFGESRLPKDYFACRSLTTVLEIPRLALTTATLGDLNDRYFPSSNAWLRNCGCCQDVAQHSR